MSGFPAIEWNVFQIIGIVGAVCVLVRYVCVAFDRLPSQSPWYYLTSIISSSMVVVSLLHTLNLAALVVQGGYICVSLIGIYRHLGARKQRRAAEVSQKSMERLPALSCDLEPGISVQSA
ncbi:MAG: CBU_0592 family membrane protein [Pseudooceanicola sp.]